MHDDETEYLFSEEQMASRFQDLGEIVQNFVDEYESETEAPLTVDWSRLYVVVVSAYDDVARFKAYHLEDPRADLSDAIKRSAFLVKWIIREKPLYSGEDGNPFGPPVLANEALAIRVALSNLTVYCGRDLDLTEEKIWDFVYDFKYRDLPSDALISIFQMFVEIAENEYPINIA
ncbi:MAG: hypothetical protein ABJ215_12280 [Alphaproteobacteria bacterium]